MAAEDKTEAPTPKRRRELREAGQVARSPELGTAASFLVAWMALKAFGEHTIRTMSELLTLNFQSIKQPDMTTDGLMHTGMSNVLLFARVMAPIAGVLIMAGLAVSVLQVGFHIAPKALRPQFSRINPLQGARRFVSLRSLQELLKSLTKVFIVGFVAFKALSDHMIELSRLTGSDLNAGMSLMGLIGMELLLKVGLAFLVLALLDYWFQRWQFEKTSKMTKQEVKEEQRSQELNEQIRGRIRSLQRQLARKRMMQRVPQADVVITNPTHYAVALQYDASKMAAPVCVAKGQRLIAQQIKELARQHGVPLVENKPLAQALYRAVEVDQAIPRELYKAVAEVLAFIYRLKGQRMAS
jgi:flagellar biosynthetic protein FlhB